MINNNYRNSNRRPYIILVKFFGLSP